jgi:hypothetical protein
MATTTSLGFTDDELSVYEEGKFHRHMTPRAFSRLLKKAKWREVAAVGEVVSGPQECAYLLRGKATLQVGFGGCVMRGLLYVFVLLFKCLLSVI